MPRTRIKLRKRTELRLEPACARLRRTHWKLRCAVRLQSACVFCAWIAESARENAAGSLAARVRGLFICIPRAPPIRHRDAAERSSTNLSRGPKKRRTPRNNAAFSVRKIYQTGLPCQAEAAGSSPRKPWNPRRSRVAHPTRCARAAPACATRIRSPGRELPAARHDADAVAHPLPPRDAMLRRSCRNFDACVGDPPTPRRIRAPRRTLRHPQRRGIVRPDLGNPDAERACGFRETWASGFRARSPGRRASSES